VGENGSGKTSLLKMLPKLATPTCGEVFVDDVPLKDYDIHRLRRSMAFLTQSEEIYPVSLRENVLMGLPDDMEISTKKQELVDEAARLGGSYDLIGRLGHDTILNPPNIVGQSLRGRGSGEIGPGAMEELIRHSSKFKRTSISCGEKQRLLAYVMDLKLALCVLTKCAKVAYLHEVDKQQCPTSCGRRTHLGVGSHRRAGPLQPLSSVERRKNDCLRHASLGKRSEICRFDSVSFLWLPYAMTDVIRM
jgi:hypothetical protein